MQEIKNNIEKYKNIDFDFIFSSPMLRTKDTALIIADALNFDKNKIILDERLWEFKVGDLDGKNVEEYSNYLKNISDYFSSPLPGGESRLSVHKRMGDFIYDLEKKYSNKKILIVSHGDPTLALFLLTKGYTKDKIKEEEKDFNYFKTGEIRELEFVPLPHNEDYELDPHRPFIDDVILEKDGKEFRRVKEVMDVWFDSGSMPFAGEHYPFGSTQGKPFEKGKILYPADYISEAIDQTRGWFYTLLAVGTLMGRGTPFKNVICLGHLLDAGGKKMSKSLGNIIEPFGQMDKFGADAVRFWMYTVNQPGESKNYDEKTVAEVNNKVFNLYYNVLAFYELYRDKNLEQGQSFRESPQGLSFSKNVLDIWILERLNELIVLMTENLDNYKLLEPTRALRDFIGDLSTWYLRRSRERIKDEVANPEGKQASYGARQTLYFVLKTLAKLMAPFAPFTAEDVWQKLKNENDPESVHLAEWPESKKRTVLLEFLRTVLRQKSKVIPDMESVRRVVTLGLEARQKAGIQVRQPLNKLRIKNYELGIVYTELIKDELNVKEIIFDNSITGNVELDTNINTELKQEGNYREFVRALQDMRKKMGLTPSDMVNLFIETNDVGKKLIQDFENDLKKVALISKIDFDSNDGQEMKIDSLVFKVKIVKIER